VQTKPQPKRQRVQMWRWVRRANSVVAEQFHQAFLECISVERDVEGPGGLVDWPLVCRPIAKQPCGVDKANALIGFFGVGGSDESLSHFVDGAKAHIRETGHAQIPLLPGLAHVLRFQQHPQHPLGVVAGPCDGAFLRLERIGNALRMQISAQARMATPPMRSPSGPSPMMHPALPWPRRGPVPHSPPPT